MAKQKPEPGFDALLEKARRFCLFRERSRSEALKKVKAWGIPYPIVEKIMRALEEEKFINDTRFAEIYARSKFNSNKWGKNKISAALKQHGVSQSDIRNALLEIPFEKYQSVALELAKKKLSSLKPDEDIYIKRAKTTGYLMQRGFESDLIRKVLAEAEKLLQQ